MPQILVRGLDREVKTKLKQRARRHGRSTVAEVREILRHAVREEGQPKGALGSRIAARFSSVGLDPDHDFELRGEAPRPASFDEP
jgi:plasmid stability protein